jgi:hypothetical protein
MWALLFTKQEGCIGLAHKRSIERVLHARHQMADLLGLEPCKTQSRNQIAVLEYVTGFERVAEDLRGAYRICAGFKN